MLTLDVLEAPCTAFVAQGSPAWLQPRITAAGETLTTEVDRAAIPSSGVHVGYVTLRDLDHPEVFRSGRWLVHL